MNPIKKLLAAGATFIARTHATQINHMIQMMERAMNHDGFSVVECLSECVEFYPGAFDAGNPRKGGEFKLIEEKKWDDTPEDEQRHDVTDEVAAYKLANLPSPACSASFTRATAPPKTPSRKNGPTPPAPNSASHRPRDPAKDVRPDEVGA